LETYAYSKVIPPTAVPTQIPTQLPSTEAPTLTTSIGDQSGVQTATVYYRLMALVIGNGPQWQSLAMNDVGGGYFQATVQSANLSEQGAYPQGSLHYYVVAHDPLGNSTQSNTDTSIVVKKCETIQ